MKNLSLLKTARLRVMLAALILTSLTTSLTAQAQTPAAAEAEAKPARPASADEDEDELGEDDLTIGPIEITATPEELSRMGGSAIKVDEEELKRHSYDNPESILPKVPGLVVRQEDGMGLRPNIGIRGANSERSKKITLMEDGVLFGPAPYAAPAAYYFPLMSRMVGIEVFKGPGAILFGPQTIGGALNLQTRPVPLLKDVALVDVALGGFPAAGRWPAGKAYASFGMGRDWGGFLVEGAQLGSRGFKALDGGGPTGFNKTEAMFKGRLNTDLSQPTLHALELKLGYSHERSDETYVGLTDEDFRADPYRRYSGTQLGLMRWHRYQGSLSYLYEINERFRLQTTAYTHYFTRAWRKLNGFNEGTAIEDVLADPTQGRRRLLYDVLRGAEDSVDAQEALVIGTNQRSYLSQGVQTRGRLQLKGEGWTNRVEFGLRLHRDWIERDHTEQRFMMQGGDLNRLDGDDTTQTTLNRGEAWTAAMYALDTFYFKGLTIAPGARLELIKTRLTDHKNDDAETDNSTAVLIPGIGAHYAFTKTFGALAGVHRGFSPVAPGQADSVDPETSVNYEAGFRYVNPAKKSTGELVGFYNDYRNLIGECTFAAGCNDQQIGQQFNGGRVHVWGVEVLGQHELKLGSAWTVPLRASYALTLSEFQTGFISENPQLSEVEAGDELPYVPRHQGSLGVGVAHASGWSLDVSGTYIGEMREEAAQGAYDPARTTDDALLVDVMARYRFTHAWLAYVKLDNATNAQTIASRRPQGARPVRPMLFQVGVRWELDRPVPRPPEDPTREDPTGAPDK